MATAVADSGKRRGSREEKSSHGSVKKRRKNSRSPSIEKNQREKDSERKVKKKSMKKKQKDRDKEKRKVRSISELAELVKSGQVQLPKSLTHYQEDRLQLLDQVFTILSEDDVKGMLPDILKGLKMKRVKELCLQQLRELSEEQISDAIHGNSVPPPSLNTDSNSNKDQLGSEKEGNAMGEMEKGEGKGLKQVPQEEVMGDGGEEEGDIVITVSDVSGCSAESDQDGTSDLVSEKTVSTAAFSHGSGPDKVCAETSLNVHLSSTPKGEKQTQETEKLEGGSNMVNDFKDAVSHKEERRSSSGKEINDASQKRTQPDLLKLDTKGCRVDPEIDKADSVEEYSPVAVEKHTLAASQFLEMELRRRALEAEMRRTRGNRLSESSTSTKRATTGQAAINEGGVADQDGRKGLASSEPKSIHSKSENRRLDLRNENERMRDTTGTSGSHEKKTDHVTHGEHRAGDRRGEGQDQVIQGSERDGRGRADILEVRELLEERLRQRALQAMLKAKKNNSAT